MKIIRLDEVNSTNDYAKKHCPENDELTVVTAKKQTHGKGRRGRAFLSGEGGVYASFVCPADKLLTLRAAVAVLETLKRFGAAPLIKWPNDILINNKKICGILTETVQNVSVVGIGINVNNDISAVNDIAATLGSENSPDAVFAELCSAFERYIGFPERELIDKYKKSLILGKNAVWNGLSGTMEGITDEGYLILKTVGGDVVAAGGEVDVISFDNHARV